MANNLNAAESSSVPKAIASLAKKSSDVTRQGTQKLKFIPTLPARRKKEEAKQETPQPFVQPPERGNDRGRGRGKGWGGEGRGSATRPLPVEMTASGPFAMGPSLAGTSARRSAPRSSVVPILPQGYTKPSAPSLSLSNSAAPTLKKDKQRASENQLVDGVQTPKNESDEEVYSEPDEGVEIIDMENVRRLDWMAPETLQGERRDRRKSKGVKSETKQPSIPAISKDHGTPADNVNPSNALSLSESEEEEDLEDLVEDFMVQTNTFDPEGGIRQQLYIFQFPEPFPTFASASTPSARISREMHVSAPDQSPSTLKRKVSFAADTKSPAPESATAAIQVDPEASKETPRVDGVIGHVEVYRSGTVKMRLGNGIVLNVSEGTRPSFLQQAVHLDMKDKKLHILGKVDKRFVVSPDLDALLTCAELADAGPTVFDDAGLIEMDTV